jgi:SPP1 gp7 family putative phage head morphogenesis protein
MDIRAMQQATREAVKKKFGRKRLLVSKVTPHYPQNLEREYIRVVNSYMALFRTALAEHLPNIRALLEQGDIRTDAADDDPERTAGAPRTGAEIAAFDTAIEKALGKIRNNFAEKQGLFDLQKRVEKLARLTRKLTVREWKRVVKRTLGIDIMDDYYNDVKFQQIFDKWVADNVGLIKTIPHETLGKMREVVNGGYLRGATTKEIAREIQQSYDINKSHAQFIARDQMAKLNADITREQQQDAGINEYVWRTVNDRRVRTRHRELNGERFKYNAPPIVDGKTGRRANPGQDYQCRCVALPVFDIEGVVLPWQSGESLNFTYKTDLRKGG